MLIAEGGSLFDDKWNPTFNDEAGQRAVAWFKDLYDAKAVPAGVMNYLWDETGLGFASGTVAMNLDWGGWAAFFNSADSKISGDVGVIRAPKGSGGKRTGWSGSHTYSITNECPNKEAAASLIWILTNHEAQMHEARTGKLPTMPRVWDDIAQEMNDTGNVFMAEVFSTFKTSMAEDAVTPPLIPEWIPFSNIIYPELQKAILGDKSIKDALDYAAKETAYMMEDAGY
jgi:multiple sugar transport system substrate-binding protein